MQWWRVCAAVLLVAVAGPVALGQWVWTPETGRFVNMKRLPKETPELQIEYARSLMLEGRYSEAMRETDKFIDFYGDTPLADENQFLRGEIELADTEYMDAAREFQLVVDSYPGSAFFDRVIERQYAIGDALFERGKANIEGKADKPWYTFAWRPWAKRPFKRAIEVYSMVIDNQPFTDSAAEAQYKIGLCHFTREEYIEAAFEYRRVLEDYANSPVVPEAAYGLVQTYRASAKGPDYDQSPGQLTVAAIDEFRTRYPDDARSGELAGVRGEMRETIAEHRLRVGQFYERRQQFESARICYEVVVEQFAETGAASKAKEWLDANPSRRSAAAAFIGPAT